MIYLRIRAGAGASWPPQSSDATLDLVEVTGGEAFWPRAFLPWVVFGTRLAFLALSIPFCSGLKARIGRRA
jgi:hypothetical protein